jgi:predicted ribosomally synthesized peptide with nif11-like leader
MAHKEIERFAKDLITDETMQARVREFGTNIDEIVRYANERGYRFSKDDLKDFSDEVSQVIKRAEAVQPGIALAIVSIIIAMV